MKKEPEEKVIKINVGEHVLAVAAAEVQFGKFLDKLSVEHQKGTN